MNRKEIILSFVLASTYGIIFILIICTRLFIHSNPFLGKTIECLHAAEEAAMSCEALKARITRTGPASDSRTGLQTLAERMQSCDLDGDNALNGAEFGNCLEYFTGEPSERSANALSERAACFQRFMREADENMDDVVSRAEFGSWSARMGFDGVSTAKNRGVTARAYDFPICSEKYCYGCDMNMYCLEDGHCSNGDVCREKMCCTFVSAACAKNYDCLFYIF